jgi:hypothetical protein
VSDRYAVVGEIESAPLLRRQYAVHLRFCALFNPKIAENGRYQMKKGLSGSFFLSKRPICDVMH